MREPNMNFPADFGVQHDRWRYTLNNSTDGRVWLWIRTNNSLVAVDLPPDEADNLAKSLTGLAERGRDIIRTTPPQETP